MKLHYTQSGACVLRDQAELRVAIFRGRTFELHCYQEDGAVAMVQNCPLGCTDRGCEAWAIGAGEQDRARARDRTPWKPSTRASVQGEPENASNRWLCYRLLLVRQPSLARCQHSGPMANGWWDSRRSSSRRWRCQLLGRRWFEGNLVIVLFIGY